jgi:hypothetical protein
MKRRIEDLLRGSHRADGSYSSPLCAPPDQFKQQLRKPAAPARKRFSQILVSLALLIVLLWWARAPLPHSAGSGTSIVQYRPPQPQRDFFDDVPRDDLDDVGRDAQPNTIGSRRDDALISPNDLAMEDVGSLMDASVDEGSAIAALIEDNDTSSSGTAANGSGRVLLGVGAQCHAPTCRLCHHLLVENTPAAFVSPEARRYVSRHVRVGVVTGSFDDFFRMDLGLCTWMGHLPLDALHVFTDAANRSALKHLGTWHEARLPQHLKFSKKQTHAKGYTIDWIRAQYRFFQAFEALADDRATARSASFHWAVVVDDDTFVNIEAMRKMLRAYDLRELQFLNIALSSTTQPHGGRVSDEDDRMDALVEKHKHQFRPLYLNDNGWGGAGHFMNFAALSRFVNGSESVCVDRYMVKRGYASDVTLRHCLPKLGIHTVNEKRLNHCQAAFLKQRLASTSHVTAHMKRDVVMPRTLAMWRARLYYQVVYHRNVTLGGMTINNPKTAKRGDAQRQPPQTAYDLLMEVGSCAFGYSCKLKKCDAEHDAAALRKFMEHSGNGSYVPSL